MLTITMMVMMVMMIMMAATLHDALQQKIDYNQEQLTAFVWAKYFLETSAWPRKTISWRRPPYAQHPVSHQAKSKSQESWPCWPAGPSFPALPFADDLRRCGHVYSHVITQPQPHAWALGPSHLFVDTAM